MSFLGIDIGTSGIMASRAAMERTGNNISNANTEGYSRQSVDISANVISGLTNYDSGLATAGAGVKIDGIKRYRDDYLDNLYRTESSKLGTQTAKENYLQQVESIFNSSVTSGISGIDQEISSFMNDFQNLTNNPTDVSARQTVVADGTRLADYFHEAGNSLQNAKNTIGIDLTNTVTDINNITDKLASLNTKITSLSAKGTGSYADLLDQRDKLLDQLSGDVNYQSYEDPKTRSLTLYVGSSPLVSDNHSFPLSIDQNGNIRYSIGAGDNSLLYGIDSTGKEVNKIQDGKLSALLDMRDNILPSYSDNLDTQARTLIEKVNFIHKNGYDVNGNTGIPFFKDNSNMGNVPPGTNNAGNIQVSDAIVNSPNSVAAAVGKLTSNLQMSTPGNTITSSIPLSQNNAGVFMTPPGATGTIAISYYDYSGTLNTRTINWNNGQSLQDIVNNINSSSGGIKASFDDTGQKLTLTRDTTVGEGSKITAGPPGANTTPGSVYIQDVQGNFITGFSNIPAASVSASNPGDGENARNISSIGQQNIMGNQLSKSDITDWQSFLTGLKTNSGNPATPQGKIFSLLDPASQGIITGWTQGTVLSQGNSTILMNGLNNVIKNNTLYDPAVFTATLNNEGETLKSNYPNLSSTKMERYNRILFENTFQNDIAVSNPMTPQVQMSSFLSNMGTHAQDATQMKELYTSTTDQAQTLRQQVSGVSLDEEFSNLIKYQKSFEASSKFINISDQMLDTIINKLGI